MRKRIFSLMLVAGLIMALSIPAFAASSKAKAVTFSPSSGGKFNAKANSDDAYVFTVTAKNADSAPDVTMKDADTYGVTFSAGAPNASGDAVVTIRVDSKTTTKSSGAALQISASNSDGKTAKAKYTIVITGDNPSFGEEGFSYPSSTDVFVIGEDDSYEESFELVSGDGPLTYKVKNLPKGLTLTKSEEDEKVYTISGTPTKAGDYNVELTVTNANTKGKGSQKFTMHVLQTPEYSEEATELKAATAGKKYSQKVKFTGTISSYDVRIEPDSRDSDGNQVHNLSVKVDTKKNVIEITDNNGFYRLPDTDDGSAYVYVSMCYELNGEEYCAGELAYSIPVKAVAPKLKTKTLTAGKANTAYAPAKIELSAGTLPVQFALSIADKDQTKFGITDISELGLEFDGTSSADQGVAFVKMKEDLEVLPNLSLTKLPLQVEVWNSANEDKHTTGKLTLNITGTDPKFADTKDITGNLLAGAAFTSDDVYKGGAIEVIGSLPLSLTYKGNKEDVTVTTSQDATNGGGYFEISGTAPEKAGKQSITLTATNPVTKKKAAKKVTINFLVAPDIEETVIDKLKDVTIGKAYKAKLKATGSKTIVFVESPDVAGEDEAYTPVLKDFGLTLAKDGTISGTVKAYSQDTIPFRVQVENSIGKVLKDIELGVVAPKPKLTIDKVKDGSIGTAYALKMTAVGAYVNWSLGDGDADTLAKSGLKLSADAPVVPSTNGNQVAYISGTPTAITMASDTKQGAVTIEVTATSPGGTDDKPNAASKKIKINVRDVSPTLPSLPKLTISSNDSSANYKFHLTKGTGSYKWTLKGKNVDLSTTEFESVLASSDVSFNVTYDNSEKPKNTSGTITVTGVNIYDSKYKLKGTINVSVYANAATGMASELPAWSNALPEATFDVEGDDGFDGALPFEIELVEDVEKENDEAATEGEIKFGAARGADALTDAQRKALEDAGYVIAAVLPEITVTADGQYDIPVTLDEAAPVDGELAYFAFPVERESTDDEIADFADTEGADITTVPEAREIVVTPWFNTGVTYAPVVAVKVEATDAKDNADDAKAGDVVTEEALESK